MRGIEQHAFAPSGHVIIHADGVSRNGEVASPSGGIYVMVRLIEEELPRVQDVRVLEAIIDELPGPDAEWFHADAREAYQQEGRSLLARGWTVSEAAQHLATLYHAAHRECAG